MTKELTLDQQSRLAAAILKVVYGKKMTPEKAIEWILNGGTAAKKKRGKK